MLELQEFVEGHSMRVSSKTLETVAHTLGRFHEVCQYLPAPPRDTLMWRFSEVPRETFQKMYQQACAESDKSTMAECCDEVVRFMHEAGKELALEKRDLFETGLIHGDWHSGNLIFQGEKLAAIVDLEFSGAGCYLEDIAYGISNLCIRTTMSEEKMRLRADIMLDHYQAHRTLSWGEQVALYYAVGVKHITTVSYQLRHGEKVAGYNAAQWLERLAAQCRWLTQRSHQMRWGE